MMSLCFSLLMRRIFFSFFFFFNDTATTEIYTLSLHDALPISRGARGSWTFGSLQPSASRGDDCPLDHDGASITTALKTGTHSGLILCSSKLTLSARRYNPAKGKPCFLIPKGYRGLPAYSSGKLVSGDFCREKPFVRASRSFLPHRPGPQARSPENSRREPGRADPGLSPRRTGLGRDVARFPAEGGRSDRLRRGGLLALRLRPVRSAARGARGRLHACGSAGGPAGAARAARRRRAGSHGPFRRRIDRAYPRRDE